MIAHLKGEIEAIYEDKVVIDVNGIGYNVFMPLSSVEKLPGIGNSVKIYTYLSVREDAMWLYGFITKDDLDLYRLLISVNGVGPKAALQLMSALSGDDIKFAIMSADAKSISRAPGIGSKTAQRIILDLKDKVDLLDTFEHKLSASDVADSSLSTSMSEAVEALTALGYNRKDALRAVKSTELEPETPVEDILKTALKLISKL